MRFGCHVSIREGYLGAAKHAAQLNAKSFQYFPKNPRSLSLKSFDTDDAYACKVYCQENDILSISHSPYPTKLTVQKDKQQQVIDSLLNDLAISDACGSIGVVVHFGSSIEGNDPLAAYQVMINTLNQVLEHWDGACKLLLENNAGKPGAMGTTLEELVQIRELCDSPEKIGFCLDTCHAYASGLWDGDNWAEIETKAIELGFFDDLAAIHLNNSRYPTGSGKDRHANIFEHGYINEAQWHEIMTSPFVQEVPLILETPDEFGISHKDEIEMLNQHWRSSLNP
ncbi:deoxyribonuclease IV [Radiobacillus sp. PE A8.2]|uniref:deoxyribonuclease IV n=1 Tax=Radiobacillus sp. PE A8.2 TaxID=3380349 RepID=UPI003890652C